MVAKRLTTKDSSLRGLIYSKSVWLKRSSRWHGVNGENDVQALMWSTSSSNCWLLRDREREKQIILKEIRWISITPPFILNYLRFVWLITLLYVNHHSVTLVKVETDLRDSSISVWRQRGGRGSLMVKVSDRGWRVMSSSPVPLKIRRVGQRCTLSLSRA
ncbi:hypothetical protein TNCV_3095081 [Trichonephila clavipes]|nr:hypothetical protein TNCV_3095081 [Trichonephila clavipes]